MTERSAWLGLIALATACGVSIVTAVAEQIMTVGVAIAALIGVIKDKTETKKEGPDHS